MQRGDVICWTSSPSVPYGWGDILSTCMLCDDKAMRLPPHPTPPHPTLCDVICDQFCNIVLFAVILSACCWTITYCIYTYIYISEGFSVGSLRSCSVRWPPIYMYIVVNESSCTFLNRLDIYRDFRRFLYHHCISVACSVVIPGRCSGFFPPWLAACAARCFKSWVNHMHPLCNKHHF